MSAYILETERLLLRKYTPDDFDSLYEILSDPETMKHYPQPYDREGTWKWINWNLENYDKYGFGLWAVILKETGEFIGDCGITMQNINGKQLPEIGYHIHREHHRKGYASEAAAECMRYGFEKFGFDCLYSYMSDSNSASYGVALKNGMRFIEEYVEPDRQHTRVYSITKTDWEQLRNTKYLTVSDYRQVYEYYSAIKSAVPYWFDAGYDIWKQSFVCDTDYDGEQMFSELITRMAIQNGQPVGFIQFGISNYIYGTNGEKDHSARGGIIRTLYFEKGHPCGRELMKNAEKYFAVNKIENRFAFFHAFGMTCNAGHGKLYCPLEHIEALLAEYGYIKEHENVYYKRLITESDKCSDCSIELNYGETNPKGLCEFSILSDGDYVGAGAVVYLPQGGIAYLKWIYIEGTCQGKGLAGKALTRLFSDLHSKGFCRIDTDTADGNTIAQRLYGKTGFEDVGRTRSFIHERNCI